MNLAQAIKYVCRDWNRAMNAPGIWDRAAAAMTIKNARQTVKELREAQQRVKELGAKLKNQANTLERTVRNADPQRSP